MKTVSWLVSGFVVMFLSSSSPVILASDSPIRLASQSSIMSQGLQIRNLTLLAREEKRLPTGQTPTANRDIGFASIFIRLENTQEKEVTLIIKSIQIQNVSDGSVQMTSTSGQEIHLKPLENSENAFHLTNKMGYSEQGLVKAVLTYQLGNQIAVIESKPVKVNKH